MTAPETSRSASVFSRLRWVPSALIVGYALCCVFLWWQPQWRPEWDSATYLLTARSLVRGEGYTYLGEPFLLRPPGFAWMLVPFAGGESFDWGALNRMIMVFAASTVVMLYLALRPIHGAWLAAGVALLAGICPLTVRSFNWVLSEFPFLTFLFAAIWLLHLSARRDSKWWLWGIAGALCLAASLYLRTVAILLLPGLLLVGFRKDRGLQRWRAALPFLIVVLLAMPWFLWAREAGAHLSGPSDQLMLHDYWTAIFHSELGDPESPLLPLSGWLERLNHNVTQMLGHFPRAAVQVSGPVAVTIVILLFLAGFIIQLVRRATLFEWFVLAYLPVVATYFTYNERLVVPLAPFLILYLGVSLVALGRWLAAWSRIRWLTVAIPGLAAVALLIGHATKLPKLLAAREWQQGVVGRHWDDLFDVSLWLREYTPEGSTILCNQAPIVSVISNRRALTFQFGEAAELLDDYEIDFVVLEAQLTGRVTQSELGRLVRERSIEEWSLPSHLGGGRTRIYRLR